MAIGRILVAQENRALIDRTAASLGATPDNPEVLGSEDGMRFLTHFTRLARAGAPPRLCVIDDPLLGLGGPVAALCARAVERGLGLAPTPFLFYTPRAADDELKHLLSRVGRAVHLARSADLPVEEQSRRLTIAIEKLLVQLGGKA